MAGTTGNNFMTTLTDPPRESFRLSMLLNDTRYRSMTFQAIALVGSDRGLLRILLNNLFTNLRAAGLNIRYDFLGRSGGLRHQPDADRI